MKELTLGQFQEITALQKSNQSEEDKMTEMVAILTWKSPREVEDMNIVDFNKSAQEVIAYLSTPLPEEKPSRIINGVGITYEPAKLNRGQYITVNHFIKQDVIANAHNILAALSYNVKTGQHEPDRFSEIAESLQSAPMRTAVATCLFFCNLYAASMKTLKNFLEEEMTKKGMSRAKIQEEMNHLMTVLDGFTTQSK
jgi:hypothetical protein